MLQCIAHRRLYHKDHNQDHDDHDAAEYLCQCIHGCLRIFQQKYNDRQSSGKNVAEPCGNTEQRIETECTAADVTDIENKTAEHDHE